MERFGSGGNFLEKVVHLQNWSSLTGRSGPTETCRSIFKNSRFQSHFTVPWVPEVFFSLTSGEIGRRLSRVGRRPTQRAARAGHNREHKLQPETAQEKPLAPRVTSLRSNRNFGRNVNGRFGPVGSFVSFEQCRSIFPWLVPLVSDRSVWHNGKHPIFLQFRFF